MPSEINSTSSQGFSVYDLFREAQHLKETYLQSSEDDSLYETIDDEPLPTTIIMDLTPKRAALFSRVVSQQIPQINSLHNASTDLLQTMKNSLLGKVACLLESDNPILKIIHAIFMKIFSPYRSLINHMTSARASIVGYQESKRKIEEKVSYYERAQNADTVETITISPEDLSSLLDTSFLNDPKIAAELLESRLKEELATKGLSSIQAQSFNFPDNFVPHLDSIQTSEGFKHSSLPLGFSKGEISIKDDQGNTHKSTFYAFKYDYKSLNTSTFIKMLWMDPPSNYGDIVWCMGEWDNQSFSKEIFFQDKQFNENSTLQRFVAAIRKNSSKTVSSTRL